MLKPKHISVEVKEETTMAGLLSCGEPSDIAWEVLSEKASYFITIPDNIVLTTVRLLACPEGVTLLSRLGKVLSLVWRYLFVHPNSLV